MTPGFDNHGNHPTLCTACGVPASGAIEAPASRWTGLPTLVGDALGRAFRTLLTWQERAAQRRRLGTLDERELRDMGISPSDAMMEANKPFWRE